MTERNLFEVVGKVWQWRPESGSSAGWHFLNIEGQTAVEIRYAALGHAGKFGSIRVRAAIGDTHWSTSIFPHGEIGGFVLPLKADVRRREGIEAGCMIKVRLEI